MGEVWTEIIQELHAENVRPVTPDMEAIEAISRGIEERAKIVAGTQYELLEAQQNQNALDEQEFYAEVITKIFSSFECQRDHFCFCVDKV